MHADSIVVSLTHGDALTRLRRDLGPVSWMVFEELLLVSVDDESGFRVACRSVRDLARSLGLAKDTVARAMQRLRVIGLVVPVQTRSTNGTFDAGKYRIRSVELVRVVSEQRRSFGTPRASAGAAAAQLSLQVES